MRSFVFVLYIMALVDCSYAIDINAGEIKNNDAFYLFMIAGQSNAVGVGDKDLSVKVPQGVAFEYSSEFDKLVHLQDPVGSSHMGFQKSEDGSFLPSFALAFYEMTGRKSVLVQAAKGGSACHTRAETNNWGNWSEHGNLFKNSVAKTRMAEKKTGQKLAAIIWSQGENDGEAISKQIITREQYKVSLTDLIARYRSEFGPEIPFCIIETGRRAGNSKADHGFSIVRSVQREVANEDPYTHIVYAKTDKFIELNCLVDVVHYNQTALNKLGAEVAKHVRMTLAGSEVCPDRGIMPIAQINTGEPFLEMVIKHLNEAWQRGFSAVCLPVRLTKDCKLVVCSDSSMNDRVGNNIGVSEITLEELIKLISENTVDRPDSIRKPALLEDVLATIPADRLVFLEMEGAQEMISVLKPLLDVREKKHHVKIISSSIGLLDKVKKVIPNLPVYWSIKENASIDRVKRCFEAMDVQKLNGIILHNGVLNVELDQFLKEQNRYVYVRGLTDSMAVSALRNYNLYGIFSEELSVLKDVR